ncbi:EAL domain-containing protein [Thiomicrorhabdus sp. ZW0627]|uniref:EAL domain-containing protein n=1 Tax=Thiomicrorhabdus sp. ZW0627 TaxID=3039774 RepID=UPI002436E202|nr:EAL domain-containing protein [Thiomicrorhabdus sp. ZW0627]MDG6774729.1 EAL domain-containing protein [Thiomicrorhabdus sp. ZW0627]
MNAQILQLVKERSDITLSEAVTDSHLYSVFQPIYSFSNQACIGVEALVRGRTKISGKALSAYECLQAPDGVSKADYARLINRMHLINWKETKLPDSWLFLNLDFENVTSLNEFCLGDLLSELEIKGHEVVVEVVESEIKDEALFERLIYILRELGCLIALDDFGAGHSNIDRIWKAQPDIVKLDRQVLLEATKSMRSQSILRNLTQLIQQAGSISLLEGIETESQALLAMDAGVDLVQGYYFARPDAYLNTVEKGQRCIQQTTESYPAYVAEKQFVKQIQKKGYETLFENFSQLESLNCLEEEMKKLSSLSFVKRFFILDEFGYQISEEDEAAIKGAMDILKKGKGLCWKNRPYFTTAMQKHNQVCVSEPYRSLIDMQLCLTVSKTIEFDSGQRYVACFDVFYHDKSIETVQISV